MIRKGFFIAALTALFCLPTMSKAAVVNPWELTLGGSAANSNDFDGFTANLDAALGYYITDSLELSLRQTVGYNDFVGSNFTGSTIVAADIHFPMGDRQQFVPFVGGNIGFVYGDGISDTWIAAPEAGIKIYVNETTFVFVRAEYQFFFDKASGVDEGFDDGRFVYTLGVGFRF